MQLAKISEIVSRLLEGACLSSITLAGPELKILFICGAVRGLSSVTLDTDSFLYVHDRRKVIDFTKLGEEDFFPSRRKSILDLYELTGYEIKSVTLDKNGFIEIEIDNQFIAVYPADSTLTPDDVGSDSWNLISENNEGKTESLMSYQYDEYYINNKNDFLMGQEIGLN